MAVTVEGLLEYLKADHGVADVDAEAELFSSGLLDSVAMMGIIGFIEEQGGFDVRPADVTLENFDTVARIVAYVAENV
jgi:acyl carrier protein